MLAANGVQHEREVVEEVVEALDVAAHALGASVSALIVGVHDAAALREPEGHLFIAPAVLGVAMNEEQDAGRALRQPGAPEQPQPVIGAEVRLDPAQRPSAVLGQDGISRFSRSRAARTRFR